MNKPETRLSLSGIPIHKNLRLYVQKVTNDAVINAKHNYQAYMVNMMKGMSCQKKDNTRKWLI